MFEHSIPAMFQVNMIQSRSVNIVPAKPDEQYKIIEGLQQGPRIELFSRGKAQRLESCGAPG